MKTIFRSAALIGTALALAGPPARADSIQPIVNPSQVQFGSPQHTLSGSSDVTISTQSGNLHQLIALQGVKTTTVTFQDGTIFSSTSGIKGISTLGEHHRNAIESNRPSRSIDESRGFKRGSQYRIDRPFRNARHIGRIDD